MVSRPLKEDLEEMYWARGMSTPQIAKEIGVSYSTVNRWMNERIIEMRTHPEAMAKRSQKPSEEELRDMYWGQKMSIADIAIKIDVRDHTVYRWTRECGINLRTKSEAMLHGNFTGERNGNWHGGISFEPYCSKFNNKFKEAVRERDDYTCQLCGYEQLLGGTRLSIHHIHYDKENCYPDVVTLCRSCNSKVNSDRAYWEDYFETHLIVRGLLNWRIN